MRSRLARRARQARTLLAGTAAAAVAGTAAAAVVQGAAAQPAQPAQPIVPVHAAADSALSPALAPAPAAPAGAITGAAKPLSALPALKLNAAAPPPGTRSPIAPPALRLQPPAQALQRSAAFDLRRAVSQAVESHPAVASAVAAFRQQGSAVEAAQAGRRPQLRASLAAGRPAPGAQTGALTASQLIYDFGKVDGLVNRASANERQQFAQILQRVDEVALDTAIAAIEVHRFERLEAEALALAQSLQEIVRLADLRTGAATRADPLTARSRLEAAQATQQAAIAQKQQQLARLRLLVGAALPAPLPAPDAAAFRRWRQLGEAQPEQLPAVLLALAEVDAAQAVLASARAQPLPTVSLDASVARRAADAAGLARGTDTSVFINLSSPLYEGGLGRAQIDAAASGVLAAQGRLEAARLQARSTLRELAEQIDGLDKRLTLLAARQQKLLGARRLYREQYQAAGARSLLDLLNHEQEIYQARADLVAAQHDLWLAQLRDLHASGRLRQVFDLRRVQNLELPS